MEDNAPSVATEGIAALEKIARLDLQAETTTQLAKIIAASRPGARLPTEKELCEQLGVGRSTLREALRSLSFIGAIQTRQGAGTYVSRPDEQNIQRLFSLGLLMQRVQVNDIIEARRSLEVEAVRIAALRRTDTDKQNLTEIVQAMRESASSGTGKRPAEYDVEFHITLARASHNSVLIHLINGMRGLLEVWMDKVLDQPSWTERAMRDHDLILDAVLSGDAEQAAECMRSHLLNAAEHILLLIGQEQSTSDYIGLLMPPNHKSD